MKYSDVYSGHYASTFKRGILGVQPPSHHEMFSKIFFSTCFFIGIYKVNLIIHLKFIFILINLTYRKCFFLHTCLTSMHTRLSFICVFILSITLYHIISFRNKDITMYFLKKIKFYTTPIYVLQFTTLSGILYIGTNYYIILSINVLYIILILTFM